MKKIDLFRKWLTRSCVWYTLIALVLLFIKIALDGMIDGEISVLSFLLFFPCALTVSAADLILYHAKLSHGARLFLHYLVTITGFFLFLWLPGNAGADFSRHLLFLLLVTVLYWLGYLLIRVFVRRFRSAPEEKI